MDYKTSYWGIASVTDGVVTINKHLEEPRWAKLKAYVLEHETGHESGSYNLQDFRHDLKMQDKIPQEAFLFMLRHPGSMVDIGPMQILQAIVIITSGALAWVILP